MVDLKPDRQHRRVLLKAAVRAMIQMPAQILLLAYEVVRWVAGEERAFQWLSEKLARYAGRLGFYLRAGVYSKLLAVCGDNVQIGYGTVLSKRDVHRFWNVNKLK